MTLAEIREGWDQAAREDAMFNILSLPGKDNGRWDTEEFFDRGHTEIQQLMSHLNFDLDLTIGHHRALDFGCGIGRLTYALTGWFDAVDGVDISPEMVARASELCTNGACRFLVNDKPNLRILGRYRYDLVYSMITLQHMPPELAKGYVAEFIRLLRKTGVAVFEAPSCSDMPNRWLSMYGNKPEEVAQWVIAAGGEIIDIERVNDGSFRYTAVRA